jgi:hypothetical protein
LNHQNRAKVLWLRLVCVELKNQVVFCVWVKTSLCHGILKTE